MLGRKSREIADLKRALRVRTAERDAAVADARAARHAMQTATRLYAEDSRGRRLARALRACARYRGNEAVLAHHVALLQNSYDHAVGLDSPALDRAREAGR